MWTILGYFTIGLFFAEASDWAARRARLDLRYKEAYVITLLLWPIIVVGSLFSRRRQS